MKALTLHQPWAFLMAAGLKTNETRSWKTKYRGPLVIHAARVINVEAFCEFKNLGVFDGTSITDLPGGAVLAVVDLKDCIEITKDNVPDKPEFFFGDYTPGLYMWKTELIKTFKKPIPMRGYQGLWNIPDEALRVCRVCGCSEFNACEGGCCWVEEDLCSACAE